MKDVMASLTIGVKSGEECIESKLPLALRLVLVLKIVLLELGAHINSDLQFAADLSNILSARAQSCGHHAAVDVLVGSGNNLIAGLLDQHD